MGGKVAEAGLPSLVAFLVLASIVGLAAGVVLIVRPDWLVRLGKHANRWVSTRNLDRGLDRAVWFDNWFYRHHRASGMLMLAGACWVIAFFISSFDRPRMLDLTASISHMPYRLAEGLLDGFVLMALAGSVFAAVVSLFLLLRPSLLRDFEQGANCWISTRRALYPLEILHEEFDRYVLRHYRLFGLLLLFCSLFMLGVLASWLL
jgi:hypothetical protein